MTTEKLYVIWTIINFVCGSLVKYFIFFTLNYWMIFGISLVLAFLETNLLAVSRKFRKKVTKTCD